MYVDEVCMALLSELYYCLQEEDKAQRRAELTAEYEARKAAKREEQGEEEEEEEEDGKS